LRIMGWAFSVFGYNVVANRHVYGQCGQRPSLLT
jgi:hypothetical protein